MIWVVYKAKDRWTRDSVQGFDTEKEAVDWLKERPRSGVIAVFKGDRLEPEIGETKVVKKTVTGFGAFTEPTE